MLYILGETLATSREQLREEVVWFEEGTFFEYLKDFPIKGKNYMIFPRMVFFLKGHVNQTNRALYSPKDCLINIQNLFTKVGKEAMRVEPALPWVQEWGVEILLNLKCGATKQAFDGGWILGRWTWELVWGGWEWTGGAGERPVTRLPQQSRWGIRPGRMSVRGEGERRGPTSVFIQLPRGLLEKNLLCI